MSDTLAVRNTKLFAIFYLSSSFYNYEPHIQKPFFVK